LSFKKENLTLYISESNVMHQIIAFFMDIIQLQPFPFKKKVAFSLHMLHILFEESFKILILK